jgi:hypothetical protein
MSEQPKKRARFQVHLSTAIVLMFVSGLILRANIRGATGRFVVEDTDGKNTQASYLFGWPVQKENMEYRGGDIGDINKYFGDWVFPPFVHYLCDTFIALLILFSVWFICERWIRWRTLQINNKQ